MQDPDTARSLPHGVATGERSVLTSMLRGAKLTCPSCGKGAMFRRYLKVAESAPLAARNCTITAPTTHRLISPSSSLAMSW